MPLAFRKSYDIRMGNIIREVFKTPNIDFLFPCCIKRRAAWVARAVNELSHTCISGYNKVSDRAFLKPALIHCCIERLLDRWFIHQLIVHGISMSYQLYRNTTLGHTLQESLDELIQVQLFAVVHFVFVHVFLDSLTVVTVTITVSKLANTRHMNVPNVKKSVFRPERLIDWLNSRWTAGYMCRSLNHLQAQWPVI